MTRGPDAAGRPVLRILLWVVVATLLLWPGLGAARAGSGVGRAGSGSSGSGAAELDGCVPASAALVAAVEQGLLTEGSALGRARVVPASGVDATYVAAEVMRPDMSGEAGIAVWVTNHAGGRGSIFAVDGLAAASSTWTPAGDTGVGFSLRDPAARQALSCVAAG